jgi:hypothetical protein
MNTAVIVLSMFVPLADPDKPAARSFQFTYEAKVTGLAEGTKARIWLPVPPESAAQDVKVEKEELPAKARLGQEATYGNRILYLEAAAGKDGTIPLGVVYKVTRREKQVSTEMVPVAVERLLQADTNVPVGGKCLKLLEGKKVPDDPMQASRLFYDVVFGHMKYDKTGTGWGRGDAEWACDSGRGNCSDFHSLFTALSRAHKIPTLFEIGFALPAKRGEGDVAGYHCWAQFYIQDKGWVPVDISEASKEPEMKEYYFGHLTADRVLFSRGRDLELVPKQAGGPLNFFVYPYVEIDGKVLPQEHITKKFTYRDVEK